MVATEPPVPQEEVASQPEGCRLQEARRGRCVSSCPDGDQGGNGGGKDKAEQAISLRTPPQCQSAAGCSRQRVQGDTPPV